MLLQAGAHAPVFCWHNIVLGYKTVHHLFIISAIFSISSVLFCSCKKKRKKQARNQ